jgi:phosphoribosyl 1,2-cyclic phosphodiesterase
MPRFMGVGGNTSCVEVQAGPDTFILDAGTGIRALGADLVRRKVQRVTLLLSHTHWDHIQGLPFFAPAFDPRFALTIAGGHRPEQGELRAAVAAQMQAPHFPVTLSAFQARLRFRELDVGESTRLGRDIHVRTAPLRHPDGATGYRIEHGGRAVAYVTDTEHEIGALDERVLGLIAGADLVIYDATYDDEEMVRHVGWGHSTWQQGVRLCEAAGVARLAIFHHHPDRDDRMLAQISRRARARWSGAFLASEGLCLSFRRRHASRRT